jgi:peptide/nickel transport system permease protein
LTEALGLDGPLPLRYFEWLGRLLRLDLGHSYSHERAVADVLGERLLPTLLLAAAALSFGTLAGLSIGSAAAAAHGTLRDRLLSAWSFLGVSTPAFWLAMALMLALGVWLPLFPVSGMTTAFVSDRGSAATALDVLSHLALPSLALGLVVAGVIARLMRAALLEVLPAPYLQLARARGTDEGTIVYRHAFRVALARVIPVIGLQAGFVLGGAAYIEVVFQWPGIGQLLVQAILERDLMLVQGGVVLVALSYVLVNLATDVVQRLVDPRVQA